jgi:hypothetical protein
MLKKGFVAVDEKGSKCLMSLKDEPDLLIIGALLLVDQLNEERFGLKDSVGRNVALQEQQR